MSARARSRLTRVPFPTSRVLPFLALVSCLSFASDGSAATRLLRARTGAMPERTRIVLELSSSQYTLSRGDRTDSTLALCLGGTRKDARFSAPKRPEGMLRSLAVTEEKRRGTCIRLGFRPPGRAEVSTIPSGQGLPERVVIDLFPAAQAESVSAGNGSTEAGVTASTEERSAAPESKGKPAVDSKPGPDSKGKPKVVIIDPGHGGNDPGAVGPGLREKDVCLDVARRLVEEIDREPGFHAVLTREGDSLIPLRERMRRAEKDGGDLFVSIHVNAAPARAARGVEVFFLSMGAASDQASRELARLENEADPDYVNDEDEALQGLPFLVDLRQSDTLLRSSRAAEVILDILTGKDLAEARGVKQAGFAVLKSFQVPSVLVEVGFLSSPRDREDLKKPEYRARLADALCEGIRRYFRDYAPQKGAQ